MSDDRYIDPAVETMPRREIEALQERKLLDLLPYAYERSALIREVWEEHGVKPADVRSLADFREKVPFIDKDAIRRFRDRHGDPYGGLLCVPEDELIAIFSTSGTTGDPTLVPEGRRAEASGGGLVREFHEMGVRPGDHFVLMLFTFRGLMLHGAPHRLGAVPVFFDHHPGEFGRLFEALRTLQPTGMYTISGPLLMALEFFAPQMGVDIKETFASLRGIVYAGEPLGPRGRQKAAEWGLNLYQHTSLADVGAATECSEHDGCHFWEDGSFVEHLDPLGNEPVPDGERGELVATALDDRVAPLVRFRSDDIVRLTRERCRCGRTHGRFWPIGRKGDELVVQGKSLLPTDVWPAIESCDETSAGFFQIIRPARETDVLRLRVGYSTAKTSDLDELGQRVRAAVAAEVGVEPDVELVPNEELLKLGPPHKIPRVAKA